MRCLSVPMLSYTSLPDVSGIKTTIGSTGEKVGNDDARGRIRKKSKYGYRSKVKKNIKFEALEPDLFVFNLSQFNSETASTMP